MKRIIKPPYIFSALAVGGLFLGVMNMQFSPPAPPLFANLDNFVLFAQEEVTIEKDVQISSGNIGSNDKIDIEKDVIINGNLFADKITIDKNTTVNGNASFNKLKLHKEAQILGTQTKPVQLPIANLPEIPDFKVGTQDFKFVGSNNTLVAGNYRNIILEKDSRLTLTGGIYNIRKLELKENSTLIFSAVATLNIQSKLKGQKRASILPGQNLKPTDLVINYLGIRPKNEKEEKEDDDDEINSLHDDKEKKEYKDRKSGRPIVFGKNSLLNFKLLAPKAAVHIGESTILRGQIAAKKVKIGKGTIVSRKEGFIQENVFEEAILEEDGSRFFVNELILNLKDEATFLDAQNIADQIDGRIVGFIKTTNVYQIEVLVNTPEELETKIQFIRQLNNPLIEGVFRNYIFNIS